MPTIKTYLYSPQSGVYLTLKLMGLFPSFIFDTFIIMIICIKRIPNCDNGIHFFVPYKLFFGVA